MYELTKRLEIAGAHCLKLGYESPCSRPHGHNWIIHVTIQGEVLNSEGMLLDFTKIKQIVSRFDHQNINEVLTALGYGQINPTAENMARVLADLIQDQLDLDMSVVKLSIQESEGNSVCFYP